MKSSGTPDGLAGPSICSRFRLDGKTALITGATGGIGTAISRSFAEAGANLVLGSNDDTLEPLADDLMRAGTKVEAIATDVRKAEHLDRLFDRAVAVFRRVDILVCNAGVTGPIGPLRHASAAQRAETFEVNFNHAVRLTSVVAPHMARLGGGSIVLTSSIAALRGNVEIGVYALTKAALTQLARNLAVEWGPQQVRANALAPGLIRTSWADAILADPARSEQRLRQTPLRRVGQPTEVAACALFLSSQASSFVTGQTLIVDGGTMISDGN